MNRILLLSFAILCFIKGGNAQIINTIAGNGLIGDGGPATDAALRQVWNVGSDELGNVYIADGESNRIRKIDASTGIISTFAGNGITAFSGDGGLAKKASLNNPTDIFIAPSGNFYVADYGNYRIRKVDAATGIITTVAGTGVSGYSGDNGPAIAAKIAPWRLCVDTDENIYYTDDLYYVIRKIDGITGIITTIAGTGTEGDYGPSGDGGPAILANVYYQMGICMDSKKNIYISDLGINRIRKIDAITGIINTVAGGGSNYSDSILAVNSKFHNFSVRSVSVDSADNVYIGARPYCRKINKATGIISTVVGNSSISTLGFSGDGGPATLARTAASGGMFIDKHGDVFVSDFLNKRVRKVPAATGIINTIGGNGESGRYNGDNILATEASLNDPWNICVDTASNIYIADHSNNRIRKINSSTGFISTIAGNGVAGFSADGALASSAQITVSQVRTDLQNNVYFYDGKYRIRKINALTGIITTVAGNGNAGFSGDGNLATAASILANGFCLDSDGNIFIADGGNYRIRKVDGVTGIISTIAGTGIRATNTNFGDGGPATAATFGNPEAIFTDKLNNIFIGDQSFRIIRKIDASTGTITTAAGDGAFGNLAADGTVATAGSLTGALDIFVDNEGNLYFQEGATISTSTISNVIFYLAESAAIRKVEKSTGIITTIAGNKTPGFSGDGGLAINANINPASFTFDKTGTNLFIADAANNRIRKVSLSTIALCAGSANKTLTSNFTGTTYQWEINNGTGFIPITNNANYTGTNTVSLQLINIPTSWTGYEFRCKADAAYSSVFTLKFIQQWTGAVDTLWNNSGNWSCSEPDANTDVVINGNGNILVNTNTTIRSLQISPGATLTVAPGVNFTILH